MIAADLREESEIKRSVLEAVAKLKKLDILINNVGIGRITKLSDPELIEHFDAIFQLNVRTPLIFTKLASKYLIESKGCIVNVSSVSAVKAAPMMLPYAMSKAAVTMMTKNCAIDLGRRGVRVNEVK